MDTYTECLAATKSYWKGIDGLQMLQFAWRVYWQCFTVHLDLFWWLHKSCVVLHTIVKIRRPYTMIDVIVSIS